MSDLQLQQKLQKAGIISELVVLLLIPWAQLIKILLSSDWNDVASSEREFFLFASGIFALGCIGHISLRFVKRVKTSSILIRALRILTWVLTIVNMIETQVMVHDTGDEVRNKTSLAFSFISIGFLGAIMLNSIGNESAKKALISVSALYYSIRVAIYSKNAVLPVYTLVLCVVLVGFMTWINPFLVVGFRNGAYRN